MDSINVFVCEDDARFSHLLRMRLEQEPDIAVIGHAASKETLYAALEGASVDVLLLDLNLADDNSYDGIEISIDLHHKRPEIKTIVLSSWDDEELVEHAFVYGRVANYVTKMHAQEIADAIRDAMSNRAGIHHSTSHKLLNRVIAANRHELRRRMTPKQLQILTLLEQGHTRKQIAETMFYSEQNINQEICKVSRLLKGKFPYLAFFRLRKHNYRHLVQLAKQLGLFDERHREP